MTIHLPRASLLAVILLALDVASLSLCTAQHERGRPNILFAMADDWGWPHAGAYGDEVVATPTFDRIAAEGARFDFAFVSSPSCTPSRNAVLTGQQFYRLGEGANLHSTLDASIPTFVSLLEGSGYEVGHWRKAWGPGRFQAGGYERNPCGPPSGFDEFLATRDPDRPFCFWFGTSDPHRGYERDSGTGSGIDAEALRVPAFLPDHDVVRRDIADYYFEVQRWDRDVGRALELLEQAGELDNTIVVMTGDHGMPFPRCKGNLYDWGARVPLAIRWGNEISRGATVDALVSLTDLAPTFLTAAGVEVPGVMTGRSLLPLLDPDVDRRAATAAFDQVVFGRERHTPAQAIPSLAGYPSRAIRTRDWLLILNLEPDRWPAGVPANATHPMESFADCDGGPTKQLLVRAGDDPELGRLHDLCFARRPAIELYDCQADPDQVRNVAGDPANRDTVEELRAQLVGCLTETRDPRFVEDLPVRFDEFEYRTGYLGKRLEAWRKQNGEGK